MLVFCWVFSSLFFFFSPNYFLYRHYTAIYKEGIDQTVVLLWLTYVMLFVTGTSFSVENLYASVQSIVVKIQQIKLKTGSIPNKTGKRKPSLPETHLEREAVFLPFPRVRAISPLISGASYSSSRQLERMTQGCLCCICLLWEIRLSEHLCWIYTDDCRYCD